jgi:hypothetical protein
MIPAIDYGIGPGISGIDDDFRRKAGGGSIGIC